MHKGDTCQVECDVARASLICNQNSLATIRLSGKLLSTAPLPKEPLKVIVSTTSAHILFAFLSNVFLFFFFFFKE